MNLQTHLIVPDVVSGYELNQEDGKGFWSLIVPEATRNRIVNPSFEVDEFGWFAPSGVPFVRSNEASIFGAYSAKMLGRDFFSVRPEQAYIYTELTDWVAGEPLTASAYGLANYKPDNKMSLRISLALIANNVIQQEFFSNPLMLVKQWDRVWVTVQIPRDFLASTSGHQVQVRLYSGGKKGNDVYWDGVQAEDKGYATTYTDGDMVGFWGEGFGMYCWDGKPHRSSSTRSKQTRSGGRQVNFSELGFRMLGVEGAGLAEVDVLSSAFGQLPGRLYRQSMVRQREMVLSGFFCGDNFESLRRQHFDLMRLVSPDVSRQTGQLLLRYHQSDCCEDVLEIPAAYGGGLEGDYDNFYQSRFAMAMVADDPFFKRIGQRGQRLDFAKVFTIQHIIKRNNFGVWDNLLGGVRSSTGTAEVKKVLWVANTVVAFGNFDTASNGTAAVSLNKLAVYTDESGWQDIFPIPLLDMSDKDVKDMAVLPNGRLVFTVYDSGLGGTAVYSTNVTDLQDCQPTLEQFGNHWFDNAPKTWYAIAVGPDGGVYVGGDRDRIERWNGQAWQPYLSGIEGTIRDMAFGVDGTLYAVGEFEYVIQTSEMVDMPTSILQVLPMVTLETYQLQVLPKQISLNSDDNNVHLALTAKVSKVSDADPIVTFEWTNTASPAVLMGQFVVFDFSPTVQLKVVPRQVNIVDSRVYLTADIVTQSQTTPAVTFAWSNSANGNTATGQSVSLDLVGASLNSYITVTLVATQGTISVTNTIQFLLDSVNSLSFVPTASTDNEYLQTLTPDSLVTIMVEATTSAGKTNENKLVYYYDKDNKLTAVNDLATKDTTEYNLDVLVLDSKTVQSAATDPIASYEWTNDLTADTVTDPTGRFDFSSQNMAIGDSVTVTLKATTLQGGENINQVTFIKGVDGLKEDKSQSTGSTTIYERPDLYSPPEPVVCKNGLAIGAGKINCLGNLPSSYAVDVGPDSRAYIGAEGGLYVYTGQDVQRLADVGQVTAVKVSQKTGEVYFGGLSGLLKWNGYTVVSTGAKIEQGHVVNSIDLSDCDEELVVGLRYAGGVRVAGHTDLYYDGTAETRPSVKFFGPGRLLELTNHTIGRTIYFNHTMQAGEIVELRLENGQAKLESDYWGTLQLAAGSSTRFYLARGLNDITTWIDEGTPYCTEAVAIYRVEHVTSDALCQPELSRRFATGALPEACCLDRTIEIGDKPSNDCYKRLCAPGSMVIDPLNGQVWIQADCVKSERDCQECDPQPTVHIDDKPDDCVVYGGVPGTVVVDPLNSQVWVLAEVND